MSRYCVFFRINYDFVPNPVKLILPWMMFVLLLGTFLGTILEIDQFGKFGYVPTTGQCTIITPKTRTILELLGTYIPFLVIIICYSKTFQVNCVCSRNEELEKDENFR